MRNWVKLLIIAVILALCITVLCISLANVADGRSFVFFDGMTYLDAHSYVSGNQEYPKDNVNSLLVDYKCGEVKLVGYDGDTVKVEELGADGSRNTVHTALRGSTLFIRYGESRIAFMERLPNKTLTVYIPKNVGTVQFETDSASVLVDGIDLTRLEVDTASGDVSVKNSVAASFEIDTASGDVTVQSVAANSLGIDTASGDANVNGNFDELFFDAATGDLSFKGTADKMDLETSSGNFNIVGSVRVLEIETASGNAEVDGAPSILTFEAASGDITVKLPAGVVGVVASHSAASGDMTVLLKDGTRLDGSRFTDGKGANHSFGFETASGDVTIVFTNN